jgi:O-6-methylguanine DNA methyltransferase
VYEVVKRIPAGKVMTYQDVAIAAGSPKAVRAVGSAMHNNPDASTIPCHRVVASDGRMLGYAFGGVSSKEERLLAEGVAITDGRVDLVASRWQLQ